MPHGGIGEQGASCRRQNLCANIAAMIWDVEAEGTCLWDSIPVPGPRYGQEEMEGMAWVCLHLA